MNVEIKLLDAKNRDIKLKDITFSDKAQHIEIIDCKKLMAHSFPLKIVLNGDSSGNCISKLFVLKTALDSIDPELEVDVYLPYLPYAREDRTCDPGQSFSLKFFAKTFNLFFPKSNLYVLDIHNKKSLELFNKAFSYDLYRAIRNEECFENLFSSPNSGIICPDNGAILRTKEISKLFGANSFEDRIVFCDKKRNMKTGKIISFEVSKIDKNYKDLILFDDICDGGGTFLASAAEIRKQLPRVRLHLCVTHGIFSKGIESLEKEFDVIYSLNSFSNNKVTILNKWKDSFYNFNAYE